MFPDITTCAPAGLPPVENHWIGQFWGSPRQLSLVHHKSSKRNWLIWIFFAQFMLQGHMKNSQWWCQPQSITIPPSISPCDNTNAHYYLRRHQLIKENIPIKVLYVKLTVLFLSAAGKLLLLVTRYGYPLLFPPSPRQSFFYFLILCISVEFSQYLAFCDWLISLGISAS